MPRHHRQSRREDIRLQSMPYNTITDSRNPLAALHRLITFCFLQMSISILLASNMRTTIFTPFTNTPTTSQPLNLSRVLSAAGSSSDPNLSSDNQHSFSPGISVDLRRVRGLIARRICGVLWRRWEHLQLRPYPNPNASPRVRYMDLELDSDLTLRSGDNKVELGLLLWVWVWGWVIWMDLPLVLVSVMRLR